MEFVGNYAPCGLSPQTDGMSVILRNVRRQAPVSYTHLYFDDIAIASVRAGRNKLLKSPAELITGNAWMYTQNASINTNPTQKFGIAHPRNVIPRTR